MALMRAREGVMAPIRNMLADSGITEQQWRVLRVLSEQGPMDASSLAKQSSLLFPSLTRIAQTMKSKGLITQHADPNDKRRHMLAIADAGQMIIDQNRDQAAAIADRYRQKLGDENLDRLIDLLHMLDAEKDAP